MTAILTCPSCRTRFRGPSSAKPGTRCRCSRCSAVFEDTAAQRAYRITELERRGAVPSVLAFAASPAGALEVGAVMAPATAGGLTIGMDDPSLAPKLTSTALHGTRRTPRPVLSYRVVAPEGDCAEPEGPASLRESPLVPDRGAVRATVGDLPTEKSDAPSQERPVPSTPPIAPSDLGGSVRRRIVADLATGVAIGALFGAASWLVAAGAGLHGWPRWAVAALATVLCAWGGMRWMAPPR